MNIQNKINMFEITNCTVSYVNDCVERSLLLSIFQKNATWIVLFVLLVCWFVIPSLYEPIECLLHTIFNIICKLMIKYFEYNPVVPTRRMFFGNKKTLLVDLKALVSINYTEGLQRVCGVPCDYSIHMPENHITLQIFKRPFLDYFLETVSKWYTVVIYHDVENKYATQVLDVLDPDRNILERRLACRSSLYPGLRADYISLAFPHLREFILLDGATNFGLCYHGNCIYIKNYQIGDWDMRFLFLLPVLDCLRFVKDVDDTLKRCKLLAWCCLKCCK